MIGIGLNLVAGRTAGAAAYAGHNAVRFHQDYLVKGSNGVTATDGLTAMASTTGLFLAFKINMEALPGSGVAWTVINVGRGASTTTPMFWAYIDENGNITVAARDNIALEPVLIYTFVTELSAATDYSIHISLDATQAALTTNSPVSVVGAAMTFASDVYGTSANTTLYDLDNDVYYVQGPDFAVGAPDNPTVLNKASGNWDGGATYLLVSNPQRIRLWVDGSECLRVFAVPSEDLAADATIVFSTAQVRKRCAIGVQFDNTAGTPPTYVAATVLGYDAGTPRYVDMSYLIFDDAANADPTTTSDNGADIDLSAFEGTVLVYFGGQQVAADWNAGTNLGTGGTFDYIVNAVS
jgi:hypothetical protein